MSGLRCGLDGCGGEVMADGFCDTCGRQPARAARFAAIASVVAPDGLDDPPCPSCGAARDPQALFCEACGFDFQKNKAPSVPVARPSSTGEINSASATASATDSATASAPFSEPPTTGEPAPAWEATIETDAAWFARFCQTWKTTHGDDCPIAFPGDHRRTVTIDGPVVVIGRHAAGIDLARGPNDAAVSHRHASLIRQPDGRYALTDLDSSNGTYVEASPIAKGQTTAIPDGGSFTLGAFTRITLTLGRE